MAQDTKKCVEIYSIKLNFKNTLFSCLEFVPAKLNSNPRPLN